MYTLLLFKTETGTHKLSANKNNIGINDVFTLVPLHECSSVIFRL